MADAPGTGRRPRPAAGLRAVPHCSADAMHGSDNCAGLPPDQQGTLSSAPGHGSALRSERRRRAYASTRTLPLSTWPCSRIPWHVDLPSEHADASYKEERAVEGGLRLLCAPGCAHRWKSIKSILYNAFRKGLILPTSSMSRSHWFGPNNLTCKLLWATELESLECSPNEAPQK